MFCINSTVKINDLISVIPKPHARSTTINDYPPPIAKTIISKQEITITIIVISIISIFSKVSI